VLLLLQRPPAVRCLLHMLEQLGYCWQAQLEPQPLLLSLLLLGLGWLLLLLPA
jgi:hypothetical protein